MAAATAPHITPGEPWMSHRLLSMARGERGFTECLGTVRFVAKDGVHWHAECDACSYAVGATVEAIEQSLEERELKWYQR